MAKRDNGLGQAVQMAEDGDALSSAVLQDMAREDAPVEVEDGLPPAWKPQRGDWIMILTGQYFHCGQLLGEDYESYCLAANSVVIYDTGLLKDFYGKGVAKEIEVCPRVSIIRKGPTSQVISWPFDRAVLPAAPAGNGG
jgi:hypothetical protein